MPDGKGFNPTPCAPHWSALCGPGAPVDRRAVSAPHRVRTSVVGRDDPHWACATPLMIAVVTFATRCRRQGRIRMLIVHCPLLIVQFKNTTLWVRMQGSAEAVKAIVVPSQGGLHVSISELLHTPIRGCIGK